MLTAKLCWKKEWIMYFSSSVTLKANFLGKMALNLSFKIQYHINSYDLSPYLSNNSQLFLVPSALTHLQIKRRNCT